MFSRNRTAALSLIVILSLTAAAEGVPAAPAGEDKSAELARLRQRIAELRSELDEGRSREDVLAGELRSVEKRIAATGRALHDISTRLETKEHRLAELKKDAGSLDAEIADQRDYLARQIRAAYAAGRQELVKILLNQDDPALIGRVMTYYDYLNRARSRRIGEIVDALDELTQVQRSIQEETRRLGNLRERRLEERAKLEAGRQKRAAVLEKVKAELRTKDQRLTRMTEDAKELETIIAVLSEQLDDVPAEPRNRQPFGELKGGLDWPVQGEITVSFGSPRRAGYRSRGLLISSGEGREVRAVSHGRVAFADWLRGYGMLIIVDHGSGYMSLYGHNESLFKEVGDWIEPGEVIASVGSSGGNEDAGLYFELRKDGRPINPVAWLDR